MGLHTSWGFKLLLTVTPEVGQSINNIHCSEDALKRTLSSQILNGSRPDHLVNVCVNLYFSSPKVPVAEQYCTGNSFGNLKRIMYVDGKEETEAQFDAEYVV
jgi:hypothetical protein